MTARQSDDNAIQEQRYTVRDLLPRLPQLTTLTDRHFKLIVYYMFVEMRISISTSGRAQSPRHRLINKMWLMSDTVLLGGVGM